MPKPISESTKKSIKKFVEDFILKPGEPHETKIEPVNSESNWWDQGFRSRTCRVAVITTGGAKDYFFKEYGQSKACYKDFVTEAANVYVSELHHLHIFPEIISRGYEPFESRRKIFFKAIGEDNLEARFRQKTPSHTDILTGKENMLRPLISLTDRLPDYREEIEKEITRISEGKITQLDRITSEKSALRTTSDLSVLHPVSREENGQLYLLLKDLLEERVLKPKLITLIQNDSSPRHHLGTCLVDAGAVKYGSRLTQLAGLFASPPFDGLSHEDINVILTDYVREVNRISLEKTPEKRGVNLILEDFRDGYYLSAFQTSLAFAAAEFKYGKKMERVNALEKCAFKNLMLLNHLYRSDRTHSLSNLLLKIRDRGNKNGPK